MFTSPRLSVRKTGLVVGLAAGLMLVSACGGGDTTPSAGATPTTSTTAAAPSGTGSSSASTSVAAEESDSASPSPSADASSDPQALNQLESQVRKDSGLDSTSEPDYTSYERVSHPSGKYSFEVPTEWTEENISDTDPIIQRAPNLDKFLQSYSTGIETRRFRSASAEAMLSETAPGCGTQSPVRPYDDGRFKGIVQTFGQCAGDGNAVVVAVVSTADNGAFRAYFNSSYIDTRDVAALKRIIASVTYEPEMDD